MSYRFDLYQPGRSWLHTLDPRVKLWLVLWGALLSFLIHTWWWQLFLLLNVWGLLLSARVSRRSLLWLWRQVRLLVAFILILQTLFAPAGTVWLSLGPLTITAGGVNSAVILALRTLTMVWLTGLLLFVTEQRDLILALTSLGLPYTWGLTVSLTLRFIPALYGLAESVREAQAARGWIPQGNWLQRLRDYQPVLIAVIIGTLRLSDQVALALTARGLRANSRRSVWRSLHMRPRDWLVLVLSVLIPALAWRLGAG